MIIKFEKTDGTNTLQDAIVLPDDVIMTEAEIEKMKQERFDNWIKAITVPLDSEEPTVGE